MQIDKYNKSKMNKSHMIISMDTEKTFIKIHVLQEQEEFSLEYGPCR